MSLAHVVSPYVPVDGRPLRLTLGLRRLDLDTWLEVDEHRDRELALKRDLLARAHDDLVVHLPRADDACAETLTLIVDWLTLHHPALPRTPEPGRHPLEAAGLLVQEDVCVLTRGRDAWELTAASVCFPSRWRPAEKLGLSVAAIHDPVPGYDAISGPVDAALDRLEVRRPMWRLNWTLLPSPELCQLPGAAPTGREGYPGIDGLTYRVERQTLRRLARTGAVLFTIRTHTAPLRRLVGDPRRAADLRATLGTIDDAHADYKGWQPWLGRLLADLDAPTAPSG